MSYSFYNPVSIHYGVSAIKKLKKIIAGNTAVLVTFPEATQIGLVQQFRDMLGSALLYVEERVKPNPDIKDIEHLYNHFWQNYPQANYVIALGGGSVIDTAKALILETSCRTFAGVKDFLVSEQEILSPAAKPLIAIPTTAGTGSEVTPWATVWDRQNNQKYSLQLEETWAKFGIIDPSLMLTVPESVTLQTGLDALSHALESIWNVNSNPVSDVFAVSAARKIINVLPKLLNDLGNLELRTEMAEGALFAGLAFSNTKTALAHSLSYDVTLQEGTPHGIACSFSLPAILEHVIGVNGERDRVLTKIFDVSLDKAPEYLEQFLKRLGVPTDFEVYGIASNNAEKILNKALKGARGKNYIGANKLWVTK